MSDKHKLNGGGHQAFSTRPVGLSTYLTVQSYIDENNHSNSIDSLWHIELCCQHDHQVSLGPGEIKKIDVSDAKGALITVRNEGAWPIVVWTDY
ncbi:hypothetical protein KZ483_20960 [Paenibacillus sp. sptzw28]|uniref:hypothetical protein n=1 Tax=Paenibacillus sp. sptzw28 TaxID=715179 RepID=UPI001C6F398D|nr:hypothetical protein [Paenibacillus sp. sptzw28]QYR20276.1 hypothetical protein KZ483_20960 [Paenibacillus sp. sptzw28]